MADRDARHVSEAAAAPRAGARRAARRSARRISASGRPGPGRSVADEVRALACGLAAQGFKRGEHLAIIGDNRPRLYWAMLRRAVRWAAMPVPLYQDAVGRRDGRSRSRTPRSRFAIVEDQEQVDKLLEIAAAVPARSRTSTTTTRAACATTTQPRLTSYDALLEAGRDAATARTRASSTPRSPRAAADDVAVMFYTSGTTGKPKGVCHTHAALIDRAPRRRRVRQADRRRRGAGLPADGVGRPEHLLLRAGAGRRLRVNCPESAETVMTDLREIGPTYYFAPPRVFESLLTQVMIRMEDAGALKRWLFRHFMDVARRVGAEILDGKPVGVARPRCSTRSATCWSTGRCATCSA